MCCFINTFFYYLLIYFKFAYSVNESETSSSQPVPDDDLESVTEAYFIQTFEDGVKCTGVRYDGKDVWKYSPRERQPISVCFSTNGNRVLAKFKQSMDIVILTDNGWESFYSGNPITVDLDIGKRSSDVFQYSGAGNVHTFTAKDGHMFGSVFKKSRVVCGKKTIWKTEYFADYATKVVYDNADSKDKVVTIHQVNGLKRTFKKQNGSWRETEVKGSGTTLSQDKVEILSVGPSATKIKFEKDDHYLKYFFEDGVECLGVEYDGKKVFELDPADNIAPYPVSVYFSAKGNTAFVNFKDTRDIIVFNGTGWKSVFAGKEDPRSINVANKNICNFYTCHKNNNIYRYLPKDKVLFSKVVSQVGNEPEEVIFETKYVVQIVKEVVYDERDPNKKVLTACQVNGLKRTFKKQNGSWRETEVKGSGTTLSQDKVEILTDGGSVSATKFEKKNGYLFYEIDPRVKCTGIKYEGKDVWKRDSSDSNNPYPESVYFTIRGSTAILNFKDTRDIFRLDDDKWKSIHSGKAKETSLNVLYKNEGDQYKCDANDKVYLYTPKDNILFSKVGTQVGNEPEVIFETKDIFEMAYEVVYNETNPERLVVKILQLNGLTKKFEKTTDAGWTQSEVKGSGTTLLHEKVEIKIERQPPASPKSETPSAGSSQHAGGSDTLGSFAISSESQTVKTPPGDQTVV